MNLEQMIVKRVSIRKWQDKPVEKEKIEKLLDAARRSPSWGNVQPWRFLVIQDKAKIEKMGEMNRQSGILRSTILQKYKEPKDYLNLVALNPSVLKPEFFDDIRNALIQGNPDMIGIRLMNLNEKNKTKDG